MLLGFHHLAIATADLDRLSAFYCDLLDFSVVHRGSWAMGSHEIDDMVGLKQSSARFAVLRCSNAYLEIFEYHSPKGRPGDVNRPVCDHGYTHFCLAVREIDAEYERLTAAGMRFHCRPHNGPGKPQRAAYGRDPDGNVIELIEILAEQHPFGIIEAVAT